MGENIVVTRDKIILKSRFYDLIIPKQSVLSFRVRDCRSLSGLPVYLRIEAEKQTVVSRFFVGKIVYWWHKFLSVFCSDVKRLCPAPNYIYSENNIWPVLKKLKENNYAVDGAITELKKIEELAILTEVISWRRDLRWLVIWGFISGALVLGYVYGFCHLLTTVEIVLALVGWVVICAAVFYGLCRMIRK